MEFTKMESVKDKFTKMESVKEKFKKDDETLNENDPEEPYRRRQNEEKKSISWGQRKLLMSLVSFLSKHLDKDVENPIILYVGAAPGINIGIAKKLFPQITLHCYDPLHFKIKTNMKEKVIIYRKKFTTDLARYWADKQEKNKNIYFISDIRTADYTKFDTLLENENQILYDMELQKEWVEIIKPCKSQLKFRLPYTIPGAPDEIEYFDGILYKQPWQPQTSTETRLVISSSNLTYKKYSCQKYQSQLFYHNIFTREKNEYENEFTDAPELLNDYDSCCEINIWKDYLKCIGEEITKEKVLELSRNATKLLTQDRKYQDTLAYLRENPRAIKNRNFK